MMGTIYAYVDCVLLSCWIFRSARSARSVEELELCEVEGMLM